MKRGPNAESPGHADSSVGAYSGGFEVITAGEIFVDLIMGGFDGWPEPGKEVFANHFHRELGGGAVITACGLSRLGVSTAVFGFAGGDTKDWMITRLRDYRVDASKIQFHPREPTAITVIATGPCDRAFLTYLGASANFGIELANAAGAGQLSAARHVHLACAPGFDSAGEVLARIHGDGCSVSLDAGWHEDWLSHPGTPEALRSLDIFFPNKTEARRLTGEIDAQRILQRFADDGLQRVALKLGAEGAALLWDGKVFFGAPHRVNPVDTTGAGDSFNAGFLYAWLKGESPETCLRTACVCGAISTEAFGGIEGFPTIERLQAELGQGRA